MKYAQLTDGSGRWFGLETARKWTGTIKQFSSDLSHDLYRTPTMWVLGTNPGFVPIQASDAMKWLSEHGYDPLDTKRKKNGSPSPAVPTNGEGSRSEAEIVNHDNQFLSYGKAGGRSLVKHYRPRQLDHILGQPEAVTCLKAFAAAPFATAFIFDGETGLGKTATAYCLAAALGCNLEHEELGGMHEIPSGEQDVESVRAMLNTLRLRPLFGSGWKVLVVNEADRMSRPAEVVWLDGLEHVPAKTVIIFTTNEAGRLSQRFQNRCEVIRFQTPSQAMIQQFIKFTWECETGEKECPLPDAFGMPAIGEWTPSFRLALQKLAPRLREYLQERNRDVQAQNQCTEALGVVC